MGGFIVPGREPAPTTTSGKETTSHACERTKETGARQETRSAAGSRQRSSPEAAAPGTATHAFGTRIELPLNVWLLEELDGYHPEAKIVSSSPSAAVVEIPVGLFRPLPFRAKLTLEIPLLPRELLTRKFVPATSDTLIRTPAMPSSVPDVRAWAKWGGGMLYGGVITSHHQNPDGAICACMPGQWTLGVNQLVDYVGFCIVWIGKVLHEREIGFWPGKQHFGPLGRVRRNRPLEYCGCGGELRYKDCCEPRDSRSTPYKLWHDAQLGRWQYLAELRWQKRSEIAPFRNDKPDSGIKTHCVPESL